MVFKTTRPFQDQSILRKIYLNIFLSNIENKIYIFFFMEKIHILSLFWCFISALQKKNTCSQNTSLAKKNWITGKLPEYFS